VTQARSGRKANFAKALRVPALAPVQERSVAGEDSIVSGVAGRYASALFDLALDENSLEAVERDLDGFAALVDESADLRRLVRNPIFTADEQTRALRAVLERAGIGGLTANFLLLTARNRRLFAVADMIRAFKALTAARRGEVRADVTSAEPLSDTQTAALREALREVTGRDVTLHARVDPALIGGLVVRLGSRQIDTSLRTRLNALKIAMKGTA
jgi:F-type H+-transporting ATPase subunit delta